MIGMDQRLNELFGAVGMAGIADFCDEGMGFGGRSAAEIVGMTATRERRMVNMILMFVVSIQANFERR